VTKLIEKAIFQISIDVGVLLGETGKDSEEAIRSLLRLFEIYSIPATWAIVGCLFIEYPSTMERIADKILHGSVKHEIGYHSFTHINFSERSRYYAEIEIKEGLKIADKYGIIFKSFVFPHNAVGHEDLLKDNGFIIYRGQNIRRANANQNLISHVVCKGIDYLAPQPVDPNWRNGIWEIPASMYFEDLLLPFALLPKAKRGINAAIFSGNIFHIWFHPQDLIRNPLLINKLEIFLNFIAKKRDEGKIQALTMADLGLMLNENLSITDRIM